MANQTSGLNIGLSSKFWLLRSANDAKFTEECVMCMVKYFLVKNIHKWAKFFKDG